MDKLNSEKILRKARDKLAIGSCGAAYKLLIPLLEEMNPEALFLYSTFSISGTESNADFDERRIRLLESSSRVGYAPAICALAACYDIGDLVERDVVKASSLYKKAAEAGYAKAKLSHGLNLYYGSNGISKDEVLGLSLIRQAVNENVEGADVVLQQIEQKGAGCTGT
jgi:TPR repeat protein